MKVENQKIIFLNSYLPRTGHNFASEVIKVFTDHQVLPHSRGETRLSIFLQSYYQIRNRIYFETDKTFFDNLFVKDLRKKIISQSEKEFIMIKNTSFVGVNLLPIVFPDDIHLILIRDPKSVYLSLIKGMNLKKKSLKNRIKKAGTPIGLYPYSYSKKLSTQVLNNFPDLTNHYIIRYEDLVKKDEKVLKWLKAKFKTKKTLDQIEKEIDEIQVINSSFFKEVEAKNIWDSKPKTNNFNPLNRKEFNFLVRKGVELGSRKLREKLQYI